MTDPPRYTESEPHAARRWVKVLGIVAIIVILLIVVVLLMGGGGGHGPARHI